MRALVTSGRLAVRLACGAAFVLGATTLIPASASAQSSGMQTQIERLQRQLLEQQRAMQTLQQELEKLKQQANADREVTKRAEAKVDQVQKTADAVQKTVDAKVSSGQPRIALAVSGQVNRMINLAGDGKQTKAYFVDNNNSVSRVRFTGTGMISDDLSLGTNIEIGISPNNSGNVSQTTEDAGDKIDERVVEVVGQSKAYGKLSLGKGSMAADGTSEVDLSGTDVLAYAQISDLAGGLEFRAKNGDLTTITIANAFNDLDGSRRDRLRYDSPAWSGFSLGGSVASDQRYDAALRWSGKSGDFGAIAAAAVQEPNENGVRARYNGSASVMHDPTGLNLTVSAGTDDRDGSNPINFYVKGGWMVRPFEIGSTNFSLDYTGSSDRVIDKAGVDRADGQSIGFAVVQRLESYGTDLYAGLRWYSLDADNGVNTDAITLATFGTRIKF